MQNGIGHSHAKIILMGEHAVVYHQPAIVLPISSIKLQATIVPNAQQEIQSSFYSGSLASASDSPFAGIALLLRQLLTYFDAKAQGFKLTIESELPPERGMGSSAATAIAVIRAVYAAFGAELSQTTLLNWASVSENVIHGNPSGLDAATTGANSPLWFVKGQLPRPMHMPTNGGLIIADTGVSGQTGVAVAEVAQRIQADADLAALIPAIGNQVRQAAVCLAQDDLNQLGQLMTQTHLQLARLGVSSEKLDQFVQTANQAGALGSKLTGSGLGGCMIALVNDQASGQRVDEALQQIGARQTWQHWFKEDMN
ncbi:mevalonate kinase [Lacticaseibacillus saniviri]|uniref:Mevalonate kinase n=1 Tax=Lacticaseibacillus saniviri JCM 17471 = DSM 24301 TaxID=1293598 RepID=A0A0R2MX45_9LACO|nr:mevalonate kinase [Lacticaseibacillus saniviri]KRO18206.1 mevalonate kinase [Lacticaseibacillus saniviri JCM 17471 = DSM 24301]MCG4281374.1 mevalonate kinase [Lacticaseibacillus saniviri]